MRKVPLRVSEHVPCERLSSRLVFFAGSPAVCAGYMHRYMVANLQVWRSGVTTDFQVTEQFPWGKRLLWRTDHYTL